LGLWSKIKEKWNNWYYHDLDDAPFDWEEEEEKFDLQKDVLFEDEDQRTVFVLECLGQMAEAAEKTEQFSAEYEAVTDLLVDMEEIENLPKDIRGEIMDQAQKIVQYEKERRRIYNKSGKLSEQTVTLLERLEEEVPGGIEKMRSEEEYRRRIKHDLRRLDAERNANHYKKQELENIIANSRGVALICGVAMVLCIIMLWVLDKQYNMEVTIGYLIAGGIGAVTMTVLYLRYLDAGQELKRLGKTNNKMISLHNTVKIRYINNTNLLSFLYTKYGVESAEELEENWKVYLDEVGARQKDQRLREDLEYYYDKLTKTLRKYRIKDPEIWTHQAEALYNSKEMVEVRHALISRRQKLREQVEYNAKVASDAGERIKELGRRYPQYSAEIASMVKRYKGADEAL